MIQYRLDPKNLPRLTPEEQRRLDETPIDYSAIPELDDDFFEQARRRGRALLRQILKDPKPLYRAKHADDPWLNAMLDDVHKRISAMIEARGDGYFSHEEDLRYMRLVRELAEISTAMHDARRR